MPESPNDVVPGMKVLVTRNSGRIGKGVLKWKGKLPGHSEIFLGIELETPSMYMIEITKDGGVIILTLQSRTKLNETTDIYTNYVFTVCLAGPLFWLPLLPLIECW